MPSTLYLDAARMGQMTPSAQWALHNFVRLAGEEGCTLYFERFLKEGFAVWPAYLQARFPGLRWWGGITELKTALTNYVGLTPETPTLLAGRSTNLLKLAARRLFHGGKSVLVADLVWPSYRRVLKRVARGTNGRIHLLPIRTRILRREISTERMVNIVVDRFLTGKCSGIFLPEVSHDGIRLPVNEITRAIRQHAPTSFVVVDGSQAFGQIALNLSQVPCDFYLSGCHKWLGSHLPLGIGFCPNPATQLDLNRTCNELLDCGNLDDPLLAFLQSVEAGRQRRFTETVNLSPLFTCRGAVEDQFIEGPLIGRYRRRLANAELTRRFARMTGWTPINPRQEFQSATILLRSNHDSHEMTSSPLRERFHERGVALTCYDRGLIRLAMPCVPFSTHDAGILIQALAMVQPHASWRKPVKELSA
jgi:Aminotransferase class-V